MANGRFLSKDISTDKKVHDLQSVYCKLAWSWMIPHLDVEGRIHGDPAVLRSIIMPREKEVTDEMMESFIKEWHEKGMVVWYEVDGDKYIQCLNFEKHQAGLRKDREKPSAIPPIPGQNEMNEIGTKLSVQNKSVNTPSAIQSNDGKNRVKFKLSKDKVEDEVEVEVEGETQSSEDDNDNTDRLKFLNDFEEISGIAYPVEDGSIATRQRVIEINNALMRMMQAGVTKAIMKQAIKEMDEKNYKIKDLLSIENACMMILAKKQRTGIATEDFSQFIRR